MWAKDVAELQSKFSSPSPIVVHFQNGLKEPWNKQTKKDVASCCKTAIASIVSSAQSCLSTNGVAGVLNMLEKRIHWGFARKDYVCECLECMNELDCEAGASLAVKILRSVQFIGREDELQFVPVQLIRAFNTSSITITKNQYTQLKHDSVVPWMAGSCSYHLVVGIISVRRGTIKLWDFGVWLQPSREATEDSAILSVRVVSSTAVYDWYGTKLVANQWTNCGDGWNKSRTNEGTSCPTLPWAKNVLLPLVSLVPQQLTVFVSGCHMSANPCSGVGVARCLRSGLPLGTILVGFDASENLTGLTDGVFDRSIAYFDHNALHKNSDDDSDPISLDEQQKFDMLVRTAIGGEDGKREGNSFFLPCTDDEVDLVARCMDQLPLSSGISNRILSPSIAALSRIAKPEIPAAVEYFGMKIAPYLSLLEEEDDAASHDSTEKVYQFCNQHGYPILVKGKRQGAAVSYSWSEVFAAINMCWAKGGFLQRIVAGADKGIAFSALNGELLGAMVCTKSISDWKRKLVSGELESVSPEVYAALVRFVRETRWTGGGELEYVEDMVGDCWAIDWNPRFPSWIFACTYSGCNLPALLVAAAAANVGSREKVAVQPVSFTKTIVEIPRVNLQLHRRNPLLTLFDGLGLSTNKGSSVGLRQLTPRNARLAIRQSPSGDLQVLCSSVTATLALRENLGSLSTPKYLLSKDLVWAALDNQVSSLKDCAAMAHTAVDQRSGFDLQMCLSVKTQPHKAVLQMARQKSYFGECISLSEVRACLEAGFAPQEIVLTGPGKFWDSTPHLAMPCTKATPLKGIFADSLADLKRIVARLLDPQDWLNCDVVGVRFCPAWVTDSRFGIDCRNPKCLAAAAKLLTSLPPHIQLGTHFHHASSNLGADSWFDLANAFLSLTVAFAALCGSRPVSVVDFGGGWTADFLTVETNKKRMTALFTQVLQTMPRISSSSRPLTIQFEAGKSVTERAGAILTRVLEIRETSSDDKANGRRAEESLSPVGNQSDDFLKGRGSRGLILDCTIGDISACHTFPHPLLWLNSRTKAWEHIQTGGKDAVLGRSCMEFDGFFQVSLPPEVVTGDLLMICHSGAYDSSMQYNFGDGVGREHLELL
mmetsp:Transcript_26423/g.36365  ORF Transcript_26423/g.36365 Transcript_26423/m.36365 type:complete len:1107 (+) Transcript_26423:340-3660(+)|eukprot:CAMPEP_0170069042 /NCGR_PEP_ID=MMETSP0019_2-20121128/7837_1 /TAXON_ID=98059 /ORGANISM="Dinobryon sp., Strain UTEXLB2267" /LENGTH=1106 /DNA_ID=CAMNT_0010276931 /DNA_START=260 /DNA_END=3580 /DNA_ORIENTATION=+